MTSSPSPPEIWSKPPPPCSTSLPPPPLITSLPPVPIRLSSRFVPRIVPTGLTPGDVCRCWFARVVAAAWSGVHRRRRIPQRHLRPHESAGASEIYHRLQLVMRLGQACGSVESGTILSPQDCGFVVPVLGPSRGGRNGVAPRRELSVPLRECGRRSVVRLTPPSHLPSSPRPPISRS